ncbi:hypothetical protein [Methylobacterium sp. 17Sr1-1]|uniref:hypothetical protein n=1 Tax=Methylobacterium sp. 17Sr1-1 TaxID=2202826 RepID=UPI001FE0E386|nr:hypothetical protein [Methylobacterium sp. 17Sr1-1]
MAAAPMRKQAATTGFAPTRSATRLLQRHLAEGTPVAEDLTFRYTAAARTIRHRDRGMALLSALGVFLSVVPARAISVATGSPCLRRKVRHSPSLGKPLRLGNGKSMTAVA